VYAGQCDDDWYVDADRLQNRISELLDRGSTQNVVQRSAGFGPPHSISLLESSRHSH